MKKKTEAQKERERIAKLVRRIAVRVHDVFAQWSGRPLVVTGIDDARHVIVRDATTGRSVRVQKARLQREYARCGELAAVRAHRALAKFDAAKRARGVRR